MDMLLIRVPVQKLKELSVKNMIRFPTIKSNYGKTILTEAILVSKYCLYLEFYSNVIKYFSQPIIFQSQLFSREINDEK